MKAINSKDLKKAFLSAAASLGNNKDYINELNVFPVPDGDTGTNMTMTITSARAEVLKLNDSASIHDVSKAIANGSLRGARGNSGVITSQIFRGFRKSFQNEEDATEIDVFMLKNAIHLAAETAYKAVMKPKEGTILTVIKAGAAKADELILDENIEEMEIEEFVSKVVDAMDEALQHTPELLPVLKQAGVVDSGGMGLMCLAKGALSALKGEEILPEESDDEQTVEVTFRVKNTGIDTENIKFSYCTEFIIMLEWKNEHTEGKEIDIDKAEVELKEYLRSIGDCVVVVADDNIIKVHVHTNDPGLAFQKALTFGQLTSMKIDNMKEEHNEKIIREASKIAEMEKEAEEAAKNRARKAEVIENGFVSVVAGDGMSRIFKDLGVNVIVEGGQTMNPSTDDILKAVENINAKNVFILPNNGNIILAANQAAVLTKDKNVKVIPTTNIPEGITAMINYIADRNVDENEKYMVESLKNVKSGQVTYAVRDTEMDGFTLKTGDFMGISGKQIVAVGEDATEAALSMVESMVDEDSELVTIYYGEGIDEEKANELSDNIMEKFPEIEAVVEYGGQPVYSYIISAEA